MHSLSDGSSQNKAAETHSLDSFATLVKCELLLR